MGRQGAFVAGRKTAAVTFQFMQSGDTSSSISIIVEVFSAMEYVPPAAISRLWRSIDASRMPRKHNTVHHPIRVERFDSRVGNPTRIPPI